MLTTLFQLALVAWLPGAVIYRLPWLNRDRRASLDAEERFFWAVILSLAISLGVVMLLAVAHRYSFERLLSADLAVAGLGIVASRLRLRLGPAARRPGLTALVPLALVVLGLWRFFPPAEYIIGGKDPGTYVNEGIQIAQDGAIVVRDPVVASVPPFARDLFFPSHQHEAYYGTRFMGFFVQDVNVGTVVGQFPHLFPASIAIGYGLDGLNGALRTVGFWATLGMLAVYFAGARLIGRRAAAAAAGLLALNVVQVWFARYPNAEVVMQALLFAALLANARAHVDGDRFFAPVAALLLGLLLFLRFDAVLGVAGVLAGLTLGVFNGQRPRLSFVVTFAAMCACAAAYLLGPMRAYAHLPIVFLTHLPWWEYALLAGAAAAMFATWASASRFPRVSAWVVGWFPLVITTIVCLLAVYTLWFRQPGGRLAAHDAFALRQFTEFYLTLPGLAAALIGLTLIGRRTFWRDPALVATIVVFGCFFFFKIRIVPDHFWMARRFLPVILPGALLCAAAAALGTPREGWLSGRIPRSAIGVIFLSLLAVSYGRASQPILRHVEYEGLVPRIEELARSIGDRDLLIAESRNTGGDVHVLALPLAYIYARNVLVLDSPRPAKPDLAAFIEWARTKYTRVLFLGGAGTDLLSHQYGLQAVSSQRFQVPEYESTVNAYPRKARRKEFDFGMYAFTDPEPRSGAPFDLDVGVRDELYVLRFHAKERIGDTTFRWTQATSYVSITSVYASSRQVTLWMNDGGRPPSIAPADVSVFLHGQLLGTVRATSRFAPYTLAIPADLAARAAAFGDPVELKIVTATWNPRDARGGPDDRDLGVMVDRVAVK